MFESVLTQSLEASRGGPSIVYFDVETRSQAKLKEVGAWVYSRHPSTELLVMCFAVGGGQVNEFVPDMYNHCHAPPLWCRLVSSPKVIFECFNAFFEWCIYNHILVKKFGWPWIAPDRWRCSKATSCYLSLPRSLEGVGDALALPVQKSKAGHAVMMKLARPRKPSKHNNATYHSKAEDFLTLAKYCGIDVETQRLLSDTIGQLPPDELLIWQIDQMINKRGVHVDVEAIEGAIYLLDLVLCQYTERMIALTGGQVTTVNQVAKIIEWCRGQGIDLDDLKAGTVEDLLTNGYLQLNPDVFSDEEYIKLDLPPLVHEVLTIRQAASKSSVKKFQAMLNRVDRTDNRIRSILLYHGAGPGRWAGSGIQIQNFPRGVFKFKGKKTPDAPAVEDVVTLVKYKDLVGLQLLGGIPAILSSLLRSMLCAAPGKKLLAADYSQVEARILFWLVGEQSGLDVFASGGDIYKVMATTIYGITLDLIDEFQRWVGKQAVLGLGYQMGWERFQGQCADNGVAISEDLARHVVKTYRKKYTKVVDYWDAVNDAAIFAVRSGQPIVCGKVTFFMEGDFLKIRLPSGRCISYYKPHFVPSRFNPHEQALAYWGTDSQKHQWCSIGLYGGKITENIVQGIAACVLRCATVNCESNGVPIVLSVHDELVVEVPDEPRFTVALLIGLLVNIATWAKGLPLAATGWEGQRFKK